MSEAARPRAVRSPVIERKYGEIVEAAGRLFAQQGFDGTSLQDIANEVGVLKGSLYHYITTKEDLLFRLFEEVHEQVQRIAEEVKAEPGLNPIERIELVKGPDRSAPVVMAVTVEAAGNE